MDEDFKKKLTRYMERKRVETVEPPAGAQDEPPAAPPSPAPPAGEGDAARLDRIAMLRGRLAEIAAKKPAAPAADRAREEAPEEGGGAAAAGLGGWVYGAAPGGLVETPWGQVWVHETRTPLGERYGEVYLADALGFDGEAAAFLGRDDELAAFDAGAAVYLDTETTGLEMATATMPFLIGVGTVEGDAFVVRQIFVDRIEKERQALEYLESLLEGRGQLVTFNGRGYDVPLIRTRAIFNRLGTRVGDGIHLDLLPVVRRLFKRRIGDCSLVSCERRVLGYLREGDVPGDMIPAVYLSWLKDGRHTLMPAIFHHNAQDIKAMLALMGRIALMVRSEPKDFGAWSAGDLMSVARIDTAPRRGGKGGERGMGMAGAIWDYAVRTYDGGERREALLGLARLARRREDYASAVNLLEMALEEDAEPTCIHLMLAKVYEHGLGEFVRALEHARLAIGAEDSETWRKRVARLEKKAVGGETKGKGKGGEDR